MDRLILFIAALIVLYGAGCGDDLGYVEVPEADASIFIPADDCGEGTPFDEDEGECLPVDYEEEEEEEEEDPILPEPSPDEGEELPPEEEEEEEPPACEEGEECLPIETPEDPEDPEVPEEPDVCEDDEVLEEDGCVLVEERNWVYLKSLEPHVLDEVEEGEGGCILPLGPDSEWGFIVVRVDADGYQGERHPTDWVVYGQSVYATRDWGGCEGWCLWVNEEEEDAEDSTTNPCEADGIRDEALQP